MLGPKNCAHPIPALGFLLAKGFRVFSPLANCPPNYLLTFVFLLFIFGQALGVLYSVTTISSPRPPRAHRGDAAIE